MLLADYSTGLQQFTNHHSFDLIYLISLILGKTTLLKSKAVELAKFGQSVTYIFVGGDERTEAVMNLATKMHMSRHSSITVLSQQDLELRFRQCHPWRPLPSPLSLIKLYIEEKHPNNLIVDEVPLETTWSLL